MALAYAAAKFETVPSNEINLGSAAYSTKSIFFPHKGLDVTLGTDPLMRDDEVRNENEPLPIVPDQYDPSMSLSTPGYPDSLAFLFKWLFGAPVSTAGNGTTTPDLDAVQVPTGAFRHTWTAPYAAGNTPQTAQIIAAYADQSVFYQGNGFAMSQLDLSMDDKELMAAATLAGLYMPTISNPSLTPAYETVAIQPFKPRNCILTAWLASTAITVQGGVKFSFSNPFEKVRSMAVASKWPDILDKTDVQIMTGEIDQRYLGSADWAALVAATGFAAQARWTSDSIITGSYPYKLFIKNTNLQYTDGSPDQQQNVRRHGAKFQFKATDSGSGGSTVIQIVNATASYA